MGDRGSKNKARKEKQKKALLSAKEKRKLKSEKKSQQMRNMLQQVGGTRRT